MSNAIDRTGHRYGRWTVIGPAPSKKNGKARLWCRCDCGTERSVLSHDLRRGASTNCGCVSNRERAEALRAYNRSQGRGQPTEVESWTEDGAGWAVPQIALDWIRRPIRREAA